MLEMRAVIISEIGRLFHWLPAFIETPVQYLSLSHFQVVLIDIKMKWRCDRRSCNRNLSNCKF